MQAWYDEEGSFIIAILDVGPHNRPTECRLGFEQGDHFEGQYACPQGFCPKAMMMLFPLCEAMRSGGDWQNLGGGSRQHMIIRCPDGVVKMSLRAVRC